jgi:small subunit ribosomal protein S16
VALAVKIRLKRIGSKKAPVYRLVATESTSPRDGKFIEELGHYNPIKDPPVIQMNEEKILTWLKNGAIPSDTVRSLLRGQGILQRLDAIRKGTKDQAEPSGIPDETLETQEP